MSEALNTWREDARGATPHRANPLDRFFRWVFTHPIHVDVTVFGFLTAVTASVTTVWMVQELLSGNFPVPTGGFSILMFACGMFLRYRPGPTTVVVAILALLHVITSSVIVVGDVMIFHAMYVATVHGSERTARFALIAGLFGSTLLATYAGYDIALLPESGFSQDDFVLYTAAFSLAGGAVVLALVFIARYQRIKLRTMTMALEAREREVLNREQQAALAVAAERTRIAREMHDVVAHSLSVIIAQADGGRYVARANPEQVSSVLDTISDTGRQALADMRNLLGVLRDDAPHAPRSPQPLLAEIDTLAETMRGAGLHVTIDRTGHLDQLSSSVQIALYRIMQEALTNTLKHAGRGASVDVSLRTGADGTHLRIVDDGRGTSSEYGGAGHGLINMRQRVDMLSGQLHASPTPTGGFAVDAFIPVQSPHEGPHS